MNRTQLTRYFHFTDKTIAINFTLYPESGLAIIECSEPDEILTIPTLINRGYKGLSDDMQNAEVH